MKPIKLSRPLLFYCVSLSMRQAACQKASRREQH